jgi:hypothetical protein
VRKWWLKLATVIVIIIVIVGTAITIVIAAKPRLFVIC